MAETVATLVGKVQQRVGMTPGYDLVVDWLSRALIDDLVPYREWTWRRREGQLVFNAVYNTGTISVTRGDDYGTTAGATLTQDMIGRQLRADGHRTIIRTITRIDGTRVYFSPTWYEPSVSAVQYEIYNAFHVMPDDFDSFVTIVDLERSAQLDWWSATLEDLNSVDPQRSHSGDLATNVVLRDYASDSIGIVSAVVQASGSGNRPISGGSYAGLSDATIVVEMTSATEFRWKKNNGAYTSGITIDPDGIAQELVDGVTITFPNSVAYTSGNVFTINCKSVISSGAPRFEAWPHIKSAQVRPYLYLAKPLELHDPSAVVPKYVKTGFLVEKALAACARWKIEENKYFDLRLAVIHDARANDYLISMEREDQQREASDVRYDGWRSLPTMDSEYLAGRDVGYGDVLDEY